MSNPLQAGLSEALGLVDEITALKAEIDRMRNALEPFGDVSGEGSEDFPNDTPVVVTFGRTTHHSLTLNDFRDARQAVDAAQTRKDEPQ